MPPPKSDQSTLVLGLVEAYPDVIGRGAEIDQVKEALLTYLKSVLVSSRGTFKRTQDHILALYAKTMKCDAETIKCDWPEKVTGLLFDVEGTQTEKDEVLAFVKMIGEIIEDWRIELRLGRGNPFPFPEES